MKKNFKGYSDPIQGLSQVLTVTDGDMIEKCDKVIDIYNRFKDRGVKYGREYEFTSLGALIGLEVDKDVLIDEILEADALLASYKGFGSWNMDKSTRLMFAAILTAQEYERNRYRKLTGNSSCRGDSNDDRYYHVCNSGK